MILFMTLYNNIFKFECLFNCDFDRKIISNNKCCKNFILSK